MKCTTCLMAVLLLAHTASSSLAATIVADFDFETSGDLEGWTLNTGLAPFSQATASTGEGVLQFQQLTNPDPILGNNFDAFPGGEIQPSAGQVWSTIEFRARQLLNDTSGAAAAPGAPQAFDPGGTLLLQEYSSGGVTNYGGFNGPLFTSETQNDGWTVFKFDLATALDDAGRADNELLTRIRFDPIGTGASTNKWLQLDYIRYTAVPEPSSVMLVLGGIGMIALVSRRGYSV